MSSIWICLLTVIVYILHSCREEIEKQQERNRYRALHAQGKTQEARADLARLAIIKKQREDAAKKREAEQKGML